MSKHTPGLLTKYQSSLTGDFIILATLNSETGHQVVISTVHIVEGINSEAMADLFVAAPDMAERIDRLKSEKAELLEALRHLVKIDRLDNAGDPAMTATDTWRHEAWSNAYAIVGETKEGES